MSVARQQFYDTIEIIQSLISDPLLTDALPIVGAHNNRARILRSGLVVAAFAHLEAYIEERLEEAFDGLGSTTIPYAAFDNRLRRFFSVEAVYGLGRRVGFMERTDGLSFAELHMPRVAAFSAAPPKFTALGFNPKSANVSATDVGNLLGAFGIEHGWSKLGLICRDIGTSRVSLHDDFQNFVRIRNGCAHDSTTNVPTTDLMTHIETAILVGLSVDVAITHTVDCYVRASAYKWAARAAGRLAVKFRFLDQDPGGIWRERSSTGNRTLKIHADLATAHTAPTRPTVGFVVRDGRLFPLRVI